MSKKRTAADVIRDPESAKRTHRERVSYLNMPEVRRAMGIEKADRQEPISDERPAVREAKKRFQSMRNQKGKVN